jgi:hypothetical protein
MHRSTSLATVAAVIGMLCVSVVDASAQELSYLWAFTQNTAVHRSASGSLITQSSPYIIGFRDDNTEVSAVSAGSPNPESHAVVSPYGPSFAEASSLFNYWFAVFGYGDSAGTAVPLLLTAELIVRGDNDDSQASAVLDIGEGMNQGGVQEGTFHEQLSCPQAGDCTSGKFTVLEVQEEPVMVLSSTPDVLHLYQVSLGTFAQSSTGDGVSSAHVRSVFLQMDPTYPMRSVFYLRFSTGVQNVPPVIPVPEPSVNALMLAGLVGLGGFVGLRRRQMAA